MSRSSRILTLSAAALGLCAMAACAEADAPPATVNAAPAAVTRSVSADVVGLDGKKIGTVRLDQVPAGVLVTAKVTGVPAGEHGFHFHQKGVCDAATKFDSAGGHFAAGHAQHGYMAMTDGPHGGDMPNQHVGADGVLDTQVLNPGVTLGAGPKSVFDADGTALVIHAGVDDYTTQPSGNAGGRLACAVIAAPK
jgi:Cu-Zn family superoxide dismutase